MKIYAINQVQQKSQLNKFNSQLNQNVLRADVYNTSSVKPVHNNVINFKAAIVDPVITTLIANRYINAFKKMPKLNIVEFLKSHGTNEISQNGNYNVIFKILSGITRNENLSKKFIEEIIADPRQADDIMNLLIKKIGGSERFQEWYWDIDGYQRAYEEWFKNEIFLNNDVSLEEMLKIAPNVTIAAMRQKYLMLQEHLHKKQLLNEQNPASQVQDGGFLLKCRSALKTMTIKIASLFGHHDKQQLFGSDFFFGQVPEDIGSIDDFRQITRRVRNSKLVKEFLKFKVLMNNTEAFLAKYPNAESEATNPAKIAEDFIKKRIIEYEDKNTTPKRRLELEKEVHFLKYMNKTVINVNGKTYIYEPLSRPYSTKLLFSLRAKNSENKYFVAMEMLNSEQHTIEKENSCYRPDSPYYNAVVNYHLRANGCENVPEMKVYDYKTNAVVHSFVPGESKKYPERSDAKGVINEYSALNNEMKPLTELGIFITDCFYQNFKFDEATGKTWIIDNGHAKFSNGLKPGVKMIHNGFGDLYGRDFVSLQASMFRAMNK